MESAKGAVRNIFQRAARACGNKLRIWSLKALRGAIWRADEWIHAQELKLREEAEMEKYRAEVSPAKSAARERVHRRESGRAAHPPQGEMNLPACPPLDAAAPAIAGRTTGARARLSAVRMGPRRQSFPRLKYQHGEFVRS